MNPPEGIHIALPSATTSPGSQTSSPPTASSSTLKTPLGTSKESPFYMETMFQHAATSTPKTRPPDFMIESYASTADASDPALNFFPESMASISDAAIAEILPVIRKAQAAQASSSAASVAQGSGSSSSSASDHLSLPSSPPDTLPPPVATATRRPTLEGSNGTTETDSRTDDGSNTQVVG